MSLVLIAGFVLLVTIEWVDASDAGSRGRNLRDKGRGSKVEEN